MKTQRSQVIVLVILLIVWAVCYRVFIRVPHIATAAAKGTAAKSAQTDSLLRTRFHRVRAEMDSLYHYRIKPAAFDGHTNPFRIPTAMSGAGELADAAASKEAKASSAVSYEPPPPDFADKLLKRVVAGMRIGGVVTMGGITQLTVDGQLHREGDVFPAKIPSSTGPSKSVLIRVKHLSTTSVTLALEDTTSGGAEIRVRVN
jgi:hypothetical protein